MYREVELYILERSGLGFSGHRRKLLDQVVEGRMRELGIAGEQEYIARLGRDPAEQKELYEQITTKETHFFRNERQFQYLREIIIPGFATSLSLYAFRRFCIDAANPGALKLRIFCAGCATGEEPYSIAMVLLDTLRYPLAWDLQILAGDLSERSLFTARQGYYGYDRIRGIPPALLERFCMKREDGVEFTEEVKRIIRFVPMNLKKIVDGEPVPGGAEGELFDIIFCRNVMIYFPPELQQRLVTVLVRWLAPGGYLFTGDAEPLHLFTHDLTVIKEADCLVYRKAEKGKS